MKSTLKIDYAPNGKPIIKIIQPSDCLDLHTHPDGDYDVRDKLIADFLHTPMNCDINGLFQVYTHGSLEKDPKFHVTTIAPIDVSKQFDVFKHTILNRIIPYEDLVKINRNEIYQGDPNATGVRIAERIDISHEKYIRINEFFNWLSETEWASREEQQPSA